MCGRFAFFSNPDEVIEAFGLDEISSDFTAHYNIAPTMQIAVVPNRPTRRLRLARWGLIPSWAKDPAIWNRMINARAETLADKPAYKGAFRKRRCLVLADGFYEWRKKGKEKIPHFIRLKGGRPFAFAGLWELWRPKNDPEAAPIASCTIVTTEANALVAPIHGRMPVILPPAAHEPWLDQRVVDLTALQALLVPFAADEMECWSVSKLVNRPGQDDPACIQLAESVT